MAHSSQCNWQTIHSLSQTTSLGERCHLTCDKDQLVLLGDGRHRLAIHHGHRRPSCCHGASHGHGRRPSLRHFSSHRAGCGLRIGSCRAHAAGGIALGSSLGRWRWLGAHHVQHLSGGSAHALLWQRSVGHGSHLGLGLGLGYGLCLGADALGQCGTRAGQPLRRGHRLAAFLHHGSSRGRWSTGGLGLGDTTSGNATNSTSAATSTTSTTSTASTAMSTRKAREGGTQALVFEGLKSVVRRLQESLGLQAAVTLLKV
mmetsp:Transcript_65871/g.104484  ORF Transcript_65871/g.104484 Transcript_65871/m.104484 type:complete len:258 (-) Transcript_65871:584-1357(-)